MGIYCSRMPDWSQASHNVGDGSLVNPFAAKGRIHIVREEAFHWTFDLLPWLPFGGVKLDHLLRCLGERWRLVSPGVAVFLDGLAILERPLSRLGGVTVG